MDEETKSESEVWAARTLPSWLFAALMKGPQDAAARAVGADYLQDQGSPQALVDCYRYMGLAPKFPTERKMSLDPANLTTGWGWYHDSRIASAVIPHQIRPPKPIRLPGREYNRRSEMWTGLVSQMHRTSELVWGDFWEAERYFVNLWLGAPGEARQLLLSSVGIQTL